MNLPVLKYVPGTLELYAGKDGNMYQKKGEEYRLLPTQENSEGYLRVYYYIPGDKTRKRASVHRLVYLAWHGEIPDDFDVDHKDWNSKNNTPDNLRLLPKEVNRKRTTIKRRETMPNLEIENVETGERHHVQGIKYAAEYIGVSATTVSRVLRGRQKTAKGYYVRELDG